MSAPVIMPAGAQTPKRAPVTGWIIDISFLNNHLPLVIKPFHSNEFFKLFFWVGGEGMGQLEGGRIDAEVLGRAVSLSEGSDWLSRGLPG